MSHTEGYVDSLNYDETKSSSGARLRSNSYDKAVFRSSENSEVISSSLSNPSSQCDRKTSENQPKDGGIHMIKWIEFNYERLPILLQNQNGPCPLLAIANILLLRKRIHLSPNTNAINSEDITALIAEHMLQFNPTSLSNEDRANYEHNVQDALVVLPNLRTGIDINLKFNGVDQFEYTQECIVFDLLGIQLLHGWVIDPQNNELQKIINSNSLSYNQLVEKMIRQKQSNLEYLAQESLLIEQFLEENRSQLTHYGLLQLNEKMCDNQFAVLFRNNHFSTIWKNNEQLLLLVSDQGFLDHASIVFETLTDIDNDTSFTDGYGRQWQKPVPTDLSRDRDLAIAIHNQEQRQYFEAQSQQQQQRQQFQRQQQHYPHGFYYERASRKSENKQGRLANDSDTDCSCILL